MKSSAGILLFRRKHGFIEVFLVHPGGPFWAKKDLGAWSLPKGEFLDDEDPFAAAKREFEEETGLSVDGEFLPLGELKQSSSKRIQAWALEYDVDPARLKSNSFTLEWPPRSGKMQDFPEVDAAAWFSLTDAHLKLLRGQGPFLTRLVEMLAGSDSRGCETFSKHTRIRNALRNDSLKE